MLKLSFADGWKLARQDGGMDGMLYFLQNEIIHKNLDPLLCQKRIEYSKKEEKKREEFIEQYQRECSQRKAESNYNFYKNYTTAKQNGATDEVATKAAMNGTSNFVKCPYCGSCDVKKISTGTKIAKTAAFGVVGALDDAGKTYKCSNCGGKF